MAMGHVILREFHLDRQAKYFEDYVRQYTDMPMLVRLVKQGEPLVPERLLRASDFADNLGETNNPGVEDGRLSTRPRRASSCRAVRSASAGAKRASGIWKKRSRTAPKPSCG